MPPPWRNFVPESDFVFNQNTELMHLPGATIVLKGIDDLLKGQTTVGACLAAIASPKLKAGGLLPSDYQSSIPEAELLLYRLLRKEKGNAYGRYNALLRELVSFEQALAFLRPSGKDKV